VPPTRLERSVTNKVIGGVCGGIADYLAVDPTLVRIFFTIAGVFTGGLFILVYVVLLFVIPLPGRPVSTIAASAGTTAQEFAESLRRAADDIGRGFRSDPPAPSDATAEHVAVDPAVHARETERRRMAFGYLLIAVGVVFLLGNAGLFRLVQWQLVWPLVFVAIGVLLLAQRVRS
jgi:phage shock protein PspC (stress-responsive transcriptional regulator)